jgi:Tfp pilus assembly protein PilN
VIRINLCPTEELENHYWWVVDVAVLVLVGALAFSGVEFYLGTLKDESDNLKTQAASLESSYQTLAPDLTRFANLEQLQTDLQGKVNALKAVTVSRINKYKPVIVIETFQNLHPEGLWFTNLKFNEEYEFELYGQAFDNLLVAEFMTSMKATASQETDASDLRTQIFFSDVSLIRTGNSRDSRAVQRSGRALRPGSVSEMPPLTQLPGSIFPELGDFPNFSFFGKIEERGTDRADHAKEVATGELGKPLVGMDARRQDDARAVGIRRF